MGEPLDLSPPFLGTKSQLKHHGQDRLFAEASSGLIGSRTNRGKGRFNRISRPDVNPMLRRKVVEGEKIAFNTLTDQNNRQGPYIARPSAVYAFPLQSTC